MCSIAIVVYFRRHRDSAPGSTWSTIIAPALSFVALSGGSWLIVTNFEYFTVRSGAINWVLLGLLPAVFAAGVARTLVMKRRDPLSYQQLTQRELY
jgi:protein-S-isoprenylcysteine O-methyltransferase Ste14